MNLEQRYKQDYKDFGSSLDEYRDLKRNEIILPLIGIFACFVALYILTTM